ncbi:MAG: GTP 3',8-cyclase MoaA [Anaerolineales bacterium]|nr:MAG: GTP 3',8-cyclase MoaA [Anaerolineales bacterium]
MTQCDTFNRPIDYLRISITDRCNLRCLYCMPEEGVHLQNHEDILRYEEIITIVRAAANLGVRSIRLTGGEPLARREVVDLVAALAQIPGIDDLSMTTNGTLLAQNAEELSTAGLNRVNISLDTLRPERFTLITRRGNLEDALLGIQAAYRYHLTPVKINTVVMRGINDDEVVDLALKTINEGWNLRFIEWMPVGDSAAGDNKWESQLVTEDEIRSRIEKELGTLEVDNILKGAGPARTYRLPGAAGTLGFISAISHHFCAQCNRLRLTADGQLRPCLLADNEIDLRTPLRNGAGIQEVEALLQQAISVKPRSHHLDQAERVKNRAMSQIGG